ncbi:MAG: hypothetical protein E7547_07910 [Ruminococcaceae bacterium]|nr:hypothetical protein [Oscillospiraceae bacterium]
MKKFFSLLLCIIFIFISVAALTVIKKYIDNPDENHIANILETEPPQELTDIGSPYKFYYNRLSDIEKHAYNDILTEIYSMPESIKIPRIDVEQLDNVFSALLRDNPDLFFVGRKCTLLTEVFKTSCFIEYIFEKDEYEERKAELEKVCNEVVSSLSDPNDEWQTELEIHDYIVDNCRYMLVENEHVYSSAYGALVNGEAACEGYSKAAKLLFDRAGIESAVLSGKSKSYNGKEGPHMWNAVKISGNYYYLDCTWDDPINEDGDNVKIYAYFNLSNGMIADTHSDFSYSFDCSETAENYYVKTGKYFETYSRENENRLAELLARELEAGNGSVEIRFGSKTAYNNAVDDLIDGGRIYDVLSLTKSKTKVRFSINSLTYFVDPTLRTMTIVPERR